MQKATDIAEKITGKVADAVKEKPKEMEIHIHTKDEPMVQTERKKIPFPVNPQRKAKADIRNDTEQLQSPNTTAVNKSIIEQMKSGKNLFLLKRGS